MTAVVDVSLIRLFFLCGFSLSSQQQQNSNNNSSTRSTFTGTARLRVPITFYFAFISVYFSDKITLQMRTIIFLLCATFINFACAELDEAIMVNVGCGKKMGMDQALIEYVADVGSPLQLMAINSQCHKCIKSLVAEEGGVCSLLFVPHQWSLYIVDPATSAVIAQKDYTFGEHGKYSISLDATNAIHVEETKEPTDSMRPLNTLIIIVFVVIFISYIPSMGKCTTCRLPCLEQKRWIIAIC
jgi:hypothetical protein